MAMDSKQQQEEDPFLFILLGFDTLYSINLNHLHKEEEADLRIVFSHKTHKQPGSGNPYPFGMGLFVHNSKLHFFGGENINVDTADDDDGFQKFDFEITKQQPWPRQCLDIEDSSFNFLNRKNWDNWINKKVFSFTPILKLAALSPVSSTRTPLIPKLLSYKMRPLVFTISDKVYALSTKPFNGSMIDAGIKRKKVNVVVFEVCEQNINGKWQWAKLPKPPCRLSIAMTVEYPIYHCVIKDQLLLQTRVGDFIFDTSQKKWFMIPYEDHDVILASLEYKSQLLLFSTVGRSGCGGYLVAYNHKSFEGYNKGSSFWRSSIGDSSEKTIYEAARITNGSFIGGASLCIVGDNSICLVLNCFMVLYVCHFECTMTPSFRVGLKASKKFYLPPVMTADPHTLSSFVLREEDVGKSNQDSSTGSLNRECKAPV